VLTKIDLMDKGTDAVDVSYIHHSECFITVDNSHEQLVCSVILLITVACSVILYQNY
jgi:hypothetical protein